MRAQDYAPSRWRKFWLGCRRLWSAIWKWVTGIVVVLGLLAVGVHSHYEQRAASMDISGYMKFDQRNELFDARGIYLRPLPGTTTRRCVMPNELPQCLIQALLVMEDQGFFEHGGVNWWGVARAALHDFKTFSLAQGGSSITQQTIKLWLARKNETKMDKIDRKLLEWQLAKRIERSHSKAEILANYFNRLDFGAGLHGIAAAAEGFFGKEVKGLTLLEAATLVAIVRGPDLYSPVNHPDRTIERRNLVLRRMAEESKTSKSDANFLGAKPMVLALDAWRKKQAPNAITTMVSAELEKVLSADQLAQGGFRVELTLDSNWNGKLSAVAADHLRSIEARRSPSKIPLQAAVVVLENQTGAIRAMLSGNPSVGGQVNRVTQSWLEPGSTMKAILYANAFAHGAFPDDMVDSGPIQPGEISIGPPGYSPRNAGDYEGPVTMRKALEKSINTVAVRVGEKAGFDAFASLVDSLGLRRSEMVPRSPTSYLGGFLVRPIDLAAAYTIFPNCGPQCAPPHIIAIVRNPSGKIIFTTPTEQRPGFDSQACSLTADCLRGVIDHGTAKNAASFGLKFKAMAKTGTTNGVKDAWVAGSTESFTTVVWVGFDRRRRILDAYASVIALPLWVKAVNLAPQEGSTALRK